MLSLTKTFEQQSRLANFCRTGQYDKLEQVNENNVAHYRRLVFNVVEDMLKTAYPLTFELLEEKEWISVVKDFFAHHACTSPQVWHMPKEFYEYLSASQDHPLLKQYPFLTELLLFEWMEVEMYMMEDRRTHYSAAGDIATHPLVVNPEIHLQYFRYPVHLKSAKEICDDDNGSYFLSMHRDPEDGEIIFTSLSAALLRCLEILLETPMKIDALADTICNELNIARNAETDRMLLRFIQSSLESKLILGFRPIPI